MIFMDHHKQAVQDNLEQFSSLGEHYENLPGSRAFAYSIAKAVLELDPLATRNNSTNSPKTVGNPDAEDGGFNESILPSVKNFNSNFPNCPIKPGATILDFACGPGILDRIFVPYLEAKDKASKIVGVDINEGFLNRFKSQLDVITKDSSIWTKIVKADILSDEAEADIRPLESSADVIVCSLAYHHFHDFGAMTKKLASFLKPGGWLYIVDFYREIAGAEVSKDFKGVRHSVISPESLNEALEFAGLEKNTSAVELSTKAWVPQNFVANSPVEAKKLEAGEMRTGINDGVETCVVEWKIMVAIGRRPE
ncbi:hypothetical protein PGUG_02009 [Meyerozyma guilliermondii ATCC 6260]|uniref:Methyltransferase type 11 domain-containing protein n=1 Tax=Meyerozyma guilliermondii (strain ATCC 6260 / CBS 566 / DSM 6381 / JCM 1539 / NBRC 10279 / NRRL Y-324) TaxID=294746 RepID=A5DFF8_PICGU|nr:uncharacterized protein PGUG_02009 [Meyerozyma guilliermondii ATCC 6260]EDK37911.2 hypothetical protein PGUG_02009 [Meyerozyma guilliermondii ATCC 6260]